MLGMTKFRTLLAISFLGNGVGLLMFTITEKFYLLCFARFISGFFQIILTIYIPLYADSFGTPKTKPFLLSMVLLAGPIGVVSGYGLTGIMVQYGITWRISFVIQGVVMALSCFIMFLIPSKFINIDDVLTLKREEK